MSETMGLALLAGVVVVILLQVAVLLRGNRSQERQEAEAQRQAAPRKGWDLEL